MDSTSSVLAGKLTEFVDTVLCQVLTSDSALTEISPSPTLHPVTWTGLISGAVTDTR